MKTPRPTRIKRSNATNAFDLLTDVANAILEEPRRVDMGSWFRRIIGRKTFKPQSGLGWEKRRTYVPAPSCGTVGCIAGWVVTLNKGVEGAVDLSERSRGGLELFPCTASELLSNGSLTMSSELRHLFAGDADVYLPLVDGRFQKPYPLPTNHAVGTKAYARQVVANIRKFQSRWAAELRTKAI